LAVRVFSPPFHYAFRHSSPFFARSGEEGDLIAGNNAGKNAFPPLFLLFMDNGAPLSITFRMTPQEMISECLGPSSSFFRPFFFLPQVATCGSQRRGFPRPAGFFFSLATFFLIAFGPSLSPSSVYSVGLASGDHFVFGLRCWLLAFTFNYRSSFSLSVSSPCPGEARRDRFAAVRRPPPRRREVPIPFSPCCPNGPPLCLSIS